MKILLNEIMNERNLSFQEVAFMTGVSKSTVHRIANGQVSPTADTLEALAKGLKVHISDLYESDFKKCPISGTNFKNPLVFRFSSVYIIKG